MNEGFVQQVAALAAKEGKCFVKAEASAIGHDTVQAQGVEGFPTFVKYSGGKEVDRIGGGGLQRIKGIVGV